MATMEIPSQTQKQNDLLLDESREALTTHPVIHVRDVRKTFPNGTEALTPISLDVASGEFVSIVGPSGCGKSTLLRIIAGLAEATEGICEMSDNLRRAFVFQDATLLPWRTVRKNAQLLLELENFKRPERVSRAAAALQLVGLSYFENAYPRSLSGGMKMRLSLARSLALQPELFLMDEPFSALDEITRETLNDELSRIWASEGFTAIFITHNLYEAMYLSNRVVVMSERPGCILDVFDVPFSFPRTPELRGSAEFSNLGVRISAALRRGMDQ